MRVRAGERIRETRVRERRGKEEVGPEGWLIVAGPVIYLIPSENYIDFGGQHAQPSKIM